MNNWKMAIRKNWKTTTAGTISALASFICFSPETFGGNSSIVVIFAKFVVAGGLAGIGILAKDYNKTGGDHPLSN